MKNKIKKGFDCNIKDFCRVVTDVNTGNVHIQPVKMLNICMVKFDNQTTSKSYMYKVPSDKRLKVGTRVLVNSIDLDVVATVVSSFKIPKKYLGALMIGVYGERTPLKSVLGVVNKKIVDEVERFDVKGE